MFSDLARKLYAEKIVSFQLGTLGVLTDVDKDNDVTEANFCVPRNLKLVQVCVGAKSASAGGLNAKVFNQADVLLASSGVSVGTTAGAFASSDCDVWLSKGDNIYITIRSVNDTDDYVGASVTLVFQAPLVED